MKIEMYYKAKAEEIHKTCPVVDTHLDLAGELVFRLRNGEDNPLRDIYLPAFRKGGFHRFTFRTMSCRKADSGQRWSRLRC